MTEPLLSPVPPRRSGPWDEAGSDLGGLVRPLLEALATLAGLESTYLTVFDWERREQEVRFVYAAGKTPIREGLRVPLPADVSEATFPGVSSSQLALDHHAAPDGLVARGLGLRTFVSVPVTVARHRLFGMLCGASRGRHDLDGSAVGMFGSFASIVSEHLARVQLQEAQDRAAAAASHLLARSRFLAEAEHRIKTPLTVLQGMSLTLRDSGGRLDGATRAELERSLVNNVEILSLEIDGLLAEAGAAVQSLEPSLVESDLTDLIGEMTRAFDALGASHDVVADLEGPLRAYADPKAVYQILGHLIDNAIKYSPDGGLITVRGREITDEIVIEVADHGVGLPADGDIFEAFRRGTQDDAAPGIGLGLHIVRTLVGSMDGTVTARSDPEGGSTFTVTLPAGARP